MEDLIKNVNSLHLSIAKDVFPNGCNFECKICHRRFHATTEDCATYLKNGWPICCGITMKQS